MIAALLILAACAAEPSANYAKPQVTVVSGHGGLTAGLDASGVLTVLRWPNPGGANMMRSDLAADSIGGGRWGIEINGAWRWFGDPAAQSRQTYVIPGSMIETTVEWPDGVVAHQRLTIYPDQDIVVSLLDITGARSEPRVAYMAEFAPTTRQIPEAGEWEETFDAPRSFAAFVDRASGRVWNFRPENAGRGDWAKARTLASEEESLDTWKKFDDGVWIAMSGAGTTKNVAVAKSAKEVVGAIDSRATVIDVVVGRAMSGIELASTEIDGPYHSAIAIHIAKSYAIAEQEITDPSPDEAPPRSLLALAESVRPFAEEHWATVRALQGGESGFTVRSLSEACAWPREGALIEWARTVVQDSPPADAHSLDAYLKLIRVDDRPRKPYGSMPESVYTNGEIASPHFVVDDRAVARVLWAVKEMGMPIEAREAWLTEHWPAIEAAGEFLSTWADARRGAPLWCDDPLELSDSETQDRLFSAHAGMSAAIRLAELAEQPVPESWIARRDQLGELVEWVLTTPGKWQPGESLVLELTPLSEETIQSLYESTMQRLENPIGLTARPLASLLLQSSLLHLRDSGVATLPSERVVLDALTRLTDADHPAYAGADSLVSAEVLVALLLRQPVSAQH